MAVAGFMCLLRCICGRYGVYVAVTMVTGSISRSLSRKWPCLALMGRLYVKDRCDRDTRTISGGLYAILLLMKVVVAGKGMDIARKRKLRDG